LGAQCPKRNVPRSPSGSISTNIGVKENGVANPADNILRIKWAGINQHSRSAHVSRALVEAHQWARPDHRNALDTEVCGEKVSDVFEMRMEMENIDAGPFSICHFLHTLLRLKMNFRQFYNFPAISNTRLYRLMRQYQRHPSRFILCLGM
jgi:hypothetical protein